MSRLFTSGGQSIEAFSLSISLSMNILGWFPLGLTDLISWLSRDSGTLMSLLQHHNSKASVLQWSAFFMAQLLHPYMTTGKTRAWTRQSFVNKVMSLFFNTLSRFVKALLPKSKCILIAWLQSPSAVILELEKIKYATDSTLSPSICHEVMGPDVIICVYWKPSFKSPLSLSSFTFNKRSLVTLNFLPLEMHHMYIWCCWYFSQQSWFQLVSYPVGISHDVLCREFK